MDMERDLEGLRREINRFTVGELRMLAFFLPGMFFGDGLPFRMEAVSSLYDAFEQDAETCMKTWGAAPGVLLSTVEGLDDLYAELIVAALNLVQRLPKSRDNSGYFQGLQDNPVAIVKAYLADRRAQPVGCYSPWDKEIQEFIRETCPDIFMEWWLVASRPDEQ